MLTFFPWDAVKVSTCLIHNFVQIHIKKNMRAQTSTCKNQSVGQQFAHIFAVGCCQSVPCVLAWCCASFKKILHISHAVCNAIFFNVSLLKFAREKRTYVRLLPHLALILADAVRVSILHEIVMETKQLKCHVLVWLIFFCFNPATTTETLICCNAAAHIIRRRGGRATKQIQQAGVWNVCFI